MKVTLGQSSNVGPAVVSVPNVGTIIAWMGGGNALILMLSPDGVNFQAPVDTGQTTPVPPSSTTLNGRTFVAWMGIVNGWVNIAEISIGHDENGVPFIQGLIPNIQTIRVSTNTTPGLGTSGNQLILAYANYSGPPNAQPIEIMWTGDIIANPNNLGFAGPYNLLDQAGGREYTGTGLQMTGTQTRGAFLGWVGFGNQDVSIVRVPVNGNNGSNVTGTSKTVLFRLTGTQVGLASRNDSLYMAYKAYGGNNIYIAPEPSWRAWPNGVIDTHELTYFTPSLGVASDNSAVLLTWSGTANNSLNIESFV
jgi:hypothetical protein